MSRLEQLTPQSWYVRLALMLAVAALVYGGFWYFVTSSVRAETKEVQAQVDQLLATNAKAQIASQRLSEFKAAYARAQADYEDLKALLPEQRELTNVLQGIEDRARNRLSVTRFTPKEDFQQDFFSGKPIEIEVYSSYDNLGAFFSQIAAYQRIVSITDFKLTRIDDKKDDLKTQGQTVSAQFLLTAYYSPTDKPQSAPKPVAPAGAPAPAAVANQVAAPATK